MIRQTIQYVRDSVINLAKDVYEGFYDKPAMQRLAMIDGLLAMIDGLIESGKLEKMFSTQSEAERFFGLTRDFPDCESV